jgi:hypothetical protein
VPSHIAPRVKVVAASLACHARHNELSMHSSHYARLAAVAAADKKLITASELLEASRLHRSANRAKHEWNSSRSSVCAIDPLILENFKNTAALELLDKNTIVQNFKTTAASELLDPTTLVPNFQDTAAPELLNKTTSVQNFNNIAASELLDMTSSVQNFKNIAASELLTMTSLVQNFNDTAASEMLAMATFVQNFKDTAASEMLAMATFVQTFKNSAASELLDMTSDVQNFKNIAASELLTMTSLVQNFKDSAAAELPNKTTLVQNFKPATSELPNKTIGEVFSANNDIARASVARDNLRQVFIDNAMLFDKNTAAAELLDMTYLVQNFQNSAASEPLDKTDLMQNFKNIAALELPTMTILVHPVAARLKRPRKRHMPRHLIPAASVATVVDEAVAAAEAAEETASSVCSESIRTHNRYDALAADESPADSQLVPPALVLEVPPDPEPPGICEFCLADCGHEYYFDMIKEEFHCGDCHSGCLYDCMSCSSTAHLNAL